MCLEKLFFLFVAIIQSSINVLVIATDILSSVIQPECEIVSVQ